MAGQGGIRCAERRCLACSPASLRPGARRTAGRPGGVPRRAGARGRDRGVGARGEIALGSGGRALLGSLRWLDDPDAAGAAAAWLARHRGRALTVTVRGEPDRWGRSRIDAIVDGQGEETPNNERLGLKETGAEGAAGEPIDLAGGLIPSGLAQVDAGEGDVLCRPGLLAMEAAARRAWLGLWRAPGPAAEDGAALRAAAGQFVVAQGRIRRRARGAHLSRFRAPRRGRLDRYRVEAHLAPAAGSWFECGRVEGPDRPGSGHRRDRARAGHGCRQCRDDRGPGRGRRTRPRPGGGSGEGAGAAALNGMGGVAKRAEGSSRRGGRHPCARARQAGASGAGPSRAGPLGRAILGLAALALGLRPAPATRPARS